MLTWTYAAILYIMTHLCSHVIGVRGFLRSGFTAQRCFRVLKSVYRRHLSSVRDAATDDRHRDRPAIFIRLQGPSARVVVEKVPPPPRSIDEDPDPPQSNTLHYECCYYILLRLRCDDMCTARCAARVSATSCEKKQKKTVLNIVVNWLRVRTVRCSSGGSDARPPARQDYTICRPDQKSSRAVVSSSCAARRGHSSVSNARGVSRWTVKLAKIAQPRVYNIIKRTILRRRAAATHAYIVRASIGERAIYRDKNNNNTTHGFAVLDSRRDGIVGSRVCSQKFSHVCQEKKKTSENKEWIENIFSQ